MRPEKPSLDEVYHHGIKGMRWGVRKEEDPAGGGGSAKEYLSVISNRKPQTSKEHAAGLAKSHEKSLNKLDPSEAAGGKKKGLSPEQKKTLITIGVGAAVVGGLYFYGKSQVKATNQLEEASKALLVDMQAKAGKPIEVDLFRNAVAVSKNQTWGGHYVTDVSLARPEIVLPKGHMFHRLSTAAEDSFGSTTYATHSIEDFHRYVSEFRLEKYGAPLHHVQFHATDEIRIPQVSTVLDTLQEVMGNKVPKDKVLAAYEDMSGGGWNAPHAQNLIAALQKKGYGGIVDEMDAGVIGDTPVVLFSKNLGPKTSKKLTEAAIKTSEASLTELTQRKGLPSQTDLSRIARVATKVGEKLRPTTKLPTTTTMMTPEVKAMLTGQTLDA